MGPPPPTSLPRGAWPPELNERRRKATKLDSSGPRLLRPLRFAVNRIIRISPLLAAIEGGAVVGCQRQSFAQTARQVGIGDEDAAEGDGVRMARGDRRLRRLAGKTASGDQYPAPKRAE